MTAPAVAKMAAIDLATARRALEVAIRVALLWTIAAEEEDQLGPATPSDFRHGRIPLSELTAAPGTQGHPRHRQRAASSDTGS